MRGAPQGVGCRHLADQAPQLLVHLRPPTGPTPSSATNDEVRATTTGLCTASMAKHSLVAQNPKYFSYCKDPSLGERQPGRYQTAARLTLGCLTALSASRSRPRVTSIAVFTLPTNGTAFSIVSAAPLSHPFCRIAAPSVASAIAVPNNGIERPIRRDSR